MADQQGKTPEYMMSGTKRGNHAAKRADRIMLPGQRDLGGRKGIGTPFKENSRQSRKGTRAIAKPSLIKGKLIAGRNEKRDRQEGAGDYFQKKG